MTTSNKIKDYLKKNANQVIYVIILSILFLVFVPNQETSYLENDIENFENKYYLNFAIIGSLILILGVFITNLIKKKTYKIVLNNLFGVIIFCACFFFFFKSIVIGFALYINKQSNKIEVSKSYKIIGISDNKRLTAYDINNKNDHINENDYQKVTKNKNLYDLEKGKIVKLKFNRGILGINYIPD